MSEVVLTDTAGGVRTVTLNRPAARNAMNRELRARLTEALIAAEEDDGVSVVVLTGADPAFCAGLDLRELGAQGLEEGEVIDPGLSPWMALGAMATPVVGAVNGAAVTGGLELALGCSFLVASERAVFADTHARVGLQPGAGLTVLLPQAIGLRRAREMSFTGRFVDAGEALRIGLVTHVVPHQQLLVFTRRLAGEIAAADTIAVRTLNSTYGDAAVTTVAEGLELERRRFAAWRYTPGEVEARRQAVIDRGRSRL